MSLQAIETGLITTTSGGAATYTTPLVAGIIKAVIVTLGTSTSVDVKITPKHNTSLSIIEDTSITADGYYHPVTESCDKAGSSVAAATKTNVWSEWAVFDALAITIANGGNAATLSIKIIFDA